MAFNRPSSPFIRPSRPSGLGQKPSTFPQRPVEQRPSSFSQRMIPQKPAPVSKPALKSFFSKLISSKPAIKKPLPQKPQTFFGKKTDRPINEVIRELRNKSVSVPGKGYLSYTQKDTLLKKAFSGRGGYITEKETKDTLRRLRNEEYRAKTSQDKLALRKIREHIAKGTNLTGKY